jgi:hypothetical protein
MIPKLMKNEFGLFCNWAEVASLGRIFRIAKWTFEVKHQINAAINFLFPYVNYEQNSEFRA